jgi:hypothetical protein
MVTFKSLGYGGKRKEQKKRKKTGRNLFSNPRDMVVKGKNKRKGKKTCRNLFISDQ